jgi:hypothetical protein
MSPPRSLEARVAAPNRDRSRLPAGALLFLLPLLIGGGAAESSLPAAGDEPPAAAAPKLRFGENEADYGLLRQGERIDRELVIHNDGDAPLVIRQATPSCGCTTIHEFPKEIAPGGSGTVRFEVDSRKIHPGDTRKRIKFDNNDATQAQAAFFFTAEVLALYRSEPTTIELSGIFDQPKSATVRFIGTTEHGFELLGARSRGGLFEIVEFTEIAPGSYELKLEASAAQRPEKVRDPLDMQVGLLDGTTIEIGQWVEIEHLDPIEVIPEAALQFDNRETDALLAAGAPPLTKSVILRSRDPERKFRVISVRLEGIPEGAVTTSIDTLADGSQYSVKVIIPAYRDEAYLIGKLLIETDSPVEPLRTLHLRAKFGRKQ